MKTNRLLVAMTFTGMMLMGTSLFAQQDTDPSWYNPWDGPAKATATPQPAPVAAKSNPMSVASMAPKLDPQKPGTPASHKVRKSLVAGCVRF